MKHWIPFLVALLLVPPALADEPDRAEELTRRTYCLHTVSEDILATGTSYGLVLYRLNDRGFPTRAGALMLPDAVTALASAETLVFAGNGPRGLVVVDVSDADNPKEVARLETPGAVLRLLLDGSTLFAAMGAMGVGAIDLKDPKAPTLARRIRNTDNARDLCPGLDDGPMVAADSSKTVVFEDDVRDQCLIPGGVAVAASSDGLILLASDGLKNRVAARLDPGGACTRVHARGSLLFATADAYGFAVYNVQDVDKPVKIYPAGVPE